MSFPATVEEFMEQYEMVDKEQIYSNGTEYVPIFRMKQWFEHLKQLPSAQPEQRWIPIKWHDCTDEDREKYGFNNDIVVVFDCEMPDDNQSILVTTSHGYVNQDVCYIDDGYSLDSGWDWIDDIKAWMPLPEPYKGGEQDE